MQITCNRISSLSYAKWEQGNQLKCFCCSLFCVQFRIWVQVGGWATGELGLAEWATSQDAEMHYDYISLQATLQGFANIYNYRATQSQFDGANKESVDISCRVTIFCISGQLVIA